MSSLPPQKQGSGGTGAGPSSLCPPTQRMNEKRRGRRNQHASREKEKSASRARCPYLAHAAALSRAARGTARTACPLCATCSPGRISPAAAAMLPAPSQLLTAAALLQQCSALQPALAAQGSYGLPALQGQPAPLSAAPRRRPGALPPPAALPAASAAAAACSSSAALQAWVQTCPQRA